MKILTLNFLTCARKACKGSSNAFPLHPRDVELEMVEVDLNPPFLQNILPRLEWEALKGLCNELGLPNLPESPPDVSTLLTADGAENESAQPTQVLKDLHSLLLETNITSGKLVCANCEHEYAVKEGIANFLLPSHLV